MSDHIPVTVHQHNRATEAHVWLADRMDPPTVIVDFYNDERPGIVASLHLEPNMADKLAIMLLEIPELAKESSH